MIKFVKGENKGDKKCEEPDDKGAVILQQPGDYAITANNYRPNIIIKKQELLINKSCFVPKFSHILHAGI
jgi:hypothetical protein